MEKKKWLSFSAGIAGVLFTIFLIIMNALVLADLSGAREVLGIYYSGTGYEVGYVISLLFLAVILVLNSCLIYIKDEAKFCKLRNTMITTIVFNFAVVLINIVMCIVVDRLDWRIALTFISAVFLIVSSVIYMIILMLKSQGETVATEQTAGNKTSSATNISNVAPTAVSKEEKLLTELEKLVSLREKHILTQEEFDKIKAQIIAKHISE